MLFTACFIISLVTLVLALLGAISSMMSRYGQKRLLSPANILVAGTALASVSFFFPIYYLVFEGEGSLSGIAKALMLSLQNAVRLFGLDGDFLDMLELIDAPAAIAPFYTFVGAALYTLAPLLTFNLFLSLIKNMSAFTRYMLSLGKTAHVFTELNEKTLALAKSIRKNESPTPKFETDENNSYFLSTFYIHKAFTKHDGDIDKLMEFCQTPRTSREILEFLGKSYHSYNLKKFIQPLVESFILIPTSEKNNDSNKKFVARTK